MKILFIGGTKFVGRQMVQDALALGHQVLILQRGQTNPDIFPEVQRIQADRLDIETALPSNFFCDAIIDTCGYHPEVVRRSVQALKNKARKYIFVSTISVYKNMSEIGITEKSETSTIQLVPEVNAKITNENYGPLKVLCEKEVLGAFPGETSLILRPSIIVGVGDTSERFDFWMKEVRNKNQVHVPKDLDVPFQLIDVRALSDFAMQSLSANFGGVFNCLAPLSKTTFRDFLELLKKNLNPNVEFITTDDPKASFPYHVADPNWIGIFQVKADKAHQYGLKDISLEESIQYRRKSLFGD